MNGAFTPLLAAATGGLLGACATYYLSSRKQKFDATITLFEKYHSEEMLKYRVDAWHFMNGKYKEEPIAFGRWFIEKKRWGDKGYEAIVQILYFWYSIHTMKNQNLLNEKLAVQLFSYQWAHWFEAFWDLFQATKDDDRDTPEWMILFESGSMDWLQREKRRVISSIQP